jgi:hypothetical protein
MGKKRFKMADRTSTVEGAFEDAKSTIEALRDEMSEWADNMEGANLDQTDKYNEVTEARDQLEEAVSSLDIDLDLPDEVKDTEVKYREPLPYGRKPQPRWMQISGAVAALNAVKDAIEQTKTEPDDEAEEDEDDDQDEVDFDTPIDAITEGVDYAEAVSFPGMY